MVDTGIMSATSGRHYFGFHTITFEGMHQFNSKFAEGYKSIIKYRSSTEREVICKIQSYGPFYLILAKLCFLINNF